jgi:hypothetical protein
MATKRREPQSVTPDAVIDVGGVQVLGMNRARALELAAQWEQEADELDGNDGPVSTGSVVLDLLGGLTHGAADEARSRTLRECASRLRSIVRGE